VVGFELSGCVIREGDNEQVSFLYAKTLASISSTSVFWKHVFLHFKRPKN